VVLKVQYFGTWRWRRMEKIKVLPRIKEKRNGKTRKKKKKKKKE
jgi:hypothetical protein